VSSLRGDLAPQGDRGQRGVVWLRMRPDLPEDVLVLLDHYLLDLGGTYGDPQAGDTSTDRVRPEVEIVVYNRAILLFTTDSRRGEAVTDSPSVLSGR
jgi:hypothetical protein